MTHQPPSQTEIEEALGSPDCFQKNNGFISNASVLAIAYRSERQRREEAELARDSFKRIIGNDSKEMRDLCQARDEALARVKELEQAAADRAEKEGA